MFRKRAKRLYTSCCSNFTGWFVSCYMIACCLTFRSRTFRWHFVNTEGGRLHNVRHPVSLSKEGSLPCHTSCDTGPQFCAFLNLVDIYKLEIVKTYFKLHLHGVSVLCGLLIPWQFKTGADPGISKPGGAVPAR